MSWRKSGATPIGTSARAAPCGLAAGDAKLKVMRIAQAGELAQLNADLQLATGQIEVNTVEAASQSLFVAGWRPGNRLGVWRGVAFKFILGPAAVVAMAIAGYPITLPAFDFTEMGTILLAMLGMGGLRTVERVKGV